MENVAEMRRMEKASPCSHVEAPLFLSEVRIAREAAGADFSTADSAALSCLLYLSAAPVTGTQPAPPAVHTHRSPLEIYCYLKYVA